VCFGTGADIEQDQNPIIVDIDDSVGVTTQVSQADRNSRQP
jgi:hypothetical protein